MLDRQRVERQHHVENVDHVPARRDRVHATLSARSGEGIDVIHLWTTDPEMRALLASGRDLVVTIEPAARHG